MEFRTMSAALGMLILAEFAYHVDGGPNGFACADEPGCLFYDAIPCCVSCLKPGQCITCTECTSIGSLSGCDATTGQYGTCPVGQCNDHGGRCCMTGCNNLGKFRCDDNEICLSADGSTETVSFSLFGLADVPVSEEILAAGGATLGLAAIAPTTPGLFGGGLGFLGQPGITFGGGGILPAAALANAVVLAEVAALVSGITGAVVLTIFSSELDVTGFTVPRTVPATAVIFSEPDVTVRRTSISRRSSDSASSSDASCNRPIIPLGRLSNSPAFQHLLSKKNKIIHPISPIIQRAYMKWDYVMQKISRAKAKFYQKLGISCLVPRLLKLFNMDRIAEKLRCTLGLQDDFMEAPKCNSTRCSDSETEDREISHDLGVPNMDSTMLPVSTLDDCFTGMRKLTYGARVLIKVVDDASCDSPEYEETCNNLLEENRVIMEEECEFPGCKGVNDDKFTPCFKCNDETSRSGHYGYSENNHERQSDENFKVTQQSRRLICRRNVTGRRLCRLRVSRSVELRQRTYGRSLQFVHSEQYLSTDDLELIKYFVLLYQYLRYR